MKGHKIIPSWRRIAGKEFHHYNNYTSKREAQKQAKIRRSVGYQVRIIRNSDLKLYFLYDYKPGQRRIK